MKLLLLILASVIALVGARCGNQYEYAGTGCSGGPQPGAVQMANRLKNQYGGRTEIYNCRNVRGSSTRSLHAEGRAIDLYVSGARGRQVFDDMQGHPGVQEVIFNRRIWTAARGVHAYNGQNPHTDHVHVGLNRCGARG